MGRRRGSVTRFRMRDGSGSVELRYITEDTDRHGNVRLYVRRKGRGKVRLRQQPGTEAFLEEYRAALRRLDEAPSKPADPLRAAPGTMAWLIQQYCEKSGEFKQNSPRTRHVRRLILDAFCRHKNDGAKRYRMLEPHHLRKRRDEKAETPEAANDMVKALRQVFAWAVDNNLATANPAAAVPYFKNESDGFHSWTLDEVRQFEAQHPIGTKARLAMALLLYTLQRRSDVVNMGPAKVIAGRITLTQVKSRGKKRKTVTVSIKIMPALQKIIDATETGPDTYLVTAFGKPFTPAGFGNKFRVWCDEAGLKHCSAHGLRKASSARLAELGATENQIMATTGHSTPKEAARYTRAARRTKLADEAMALLENGENDD